MKKLLLTLTIAASSLFANAQRTIDWSTETLLGMDTIYTSASGTQLPLGFVMKNNGKDTIMPGDSVWFRFILSAGNQIITLYPGPNESTYAVRKINDTILPGDTMHITQTGLSFGLKVTNSVRVSSTVISYVINRPNLGFEVAPNNANNIKTISTVWMNEQRWPVGLSEELNKAAESLSVYPNPASDLINFAIDYNKATAVKMMDITGRVIETVNFNLNNAQVDVRNYNAGIYMYQVLDNEGKVVKAGKVTVNN
jgi:hypothetical protein